VVGVFLSTQTGSSENILSEAIEGGEGTLASVGRNYESLMQFMQNDEAETRQLLQAAQVALENAKAKLNSVESRTSDEYVLGMLENYQRVAQASDVMSQGVNNLLTINKNFTNTIYYYYQKNYTEAAEQASYCLQVLTPLLNDFATSNASLNDINVVFVPSGQRDQLRLRVGQYRNETEIYIQYVLLLRSILEGKAYLQMNSMLEESLKQLQSAIANNDYQTAQDLRQRISEMLQSLQDQSYQNAADIASQLDPSLLNGVASDVAQELRNRLRNLEGIEGFENYLQSMEKYLEALRRLKQGDKEGAEKLINEGLDLLQKGKPSDHELQGLYEGLREAFNTLELRIKGQPPQG
jgi:cellobiose-specific phosphotransferase system component IIA